MGRSISKYTYPLYTDMLSGGPGGFSSTFNGTYFLDIFPSASVAFSLRQLRKQATKCVRVRRSSDNVEQDFGFVRDYLDTASLLSFVGAGDGFVTTWYDQTTNGLDASEATTALQPQIVTSGALGTINGKNSISFNQKRLILPATSLLCDAGGLWQAFMVVRPVATTGDRCIWSADDSGNARRLGIFLKIASNSQEVTAFDTLGNDYNDIDGTHVISAGTQYIFNTRRRATTLAIFTNGLTDGSGGTAGTPAVFSPIATVGILNSTVVNTLTAFIGDIQEIIHFPDADIVKQLVVLAAINNYYKVF